MKIWRKHGIILLVLWCSLFSRQVSSEDSRDLLGFSPVGKVNQLHIESQFDDLLQAEQIGQWIRRLSSRPHHVGSTYGKENAKFIASLFRSWGYKTRLDKYQVLFPTPRIRLLEMLEPEIFIARLTEPPLPQDSSSDQVAEQLPAYNAYSPDGDTTGHLVYVNYGIPADYEQLALHGIHVRGRIVIARYGGSWRGIKPKLAAEHGALACILYSDPKDDGFFQGDAYPTGAFRNQDGAQRGSVIDIPVYPGDPLTPFIAATRQAPRLPRDKAPTLAKIPVLPISHSDALPLLRGLKGPVAPSHWRGALPITYHLGPGPSVVRMKLEFNWKLTTAFNVIAWLDGHEEPDQWILRGNHHDAWVNGAKDPVSGLASMLAEAHAVARLTKKGWRPRRTIVYAAWDAEEPGLLGSTEWVEEHSAELKKKAIAYVNTDSNGRGFLGAGGSHTLELLVNQVARDVMDPQKHISVRERSLARQIVSAPLSEVYVERLRLKALGSGSDYTPFLQHLGIASLNLAFSGESSGGSYHSIYDSFDHYHRFGDPGFQYGVTLAQMAGRIVLRLANAEVLPLEFTCLASTIRNYLEELLELADKMRHETKVLNLHIQQRLFEAVADPTQPYVVPSPQESVPYFNFTPLQDAVERLQTSAVKYRESYRGFESGGAIQRQTRLKLNQVLMGVEQKFIHQDGLPKRSWYRHQIYAPGLHTGYGVKTLPGIREAIEQREWNQVEIQMQKVVQVIQNFSSVVDQATQLLAQ